MAERSAAVRHARAQVRELRLANVRSVQVQHSFCEYLRAILGVRGDSIELTGPEEWLRGLARACGDIDAAFEIGRQLQLDV